MRLAAVLHLRHGVGIGHQFADGRIEKILDRVDLDVAARDHPRQHLRQLVALRDRQRPRRAPGIEPVAPQFSGRRLRHAEKRRRQFNGQSGYGRRHAAVSPRVTPSSLRISGFNVKAKQTCVNSSRRDAPEVCGKFSPSENERAQGMPDARCTRDLVCNVHKKCAHEHTGQRRTSDIPCAMALRLISCSPQSGRARCHCRSSEALASLELDASIRGVRTTRLYRTPLPRSSVATSASTATRPTFVTMANAPLSRTGWPKICH